MQSNSPNTNVGQNFFKIRYLNVGHVERLSVTFALVCEHPDPFEIDGGFKEFSFSLTFFVGISQVEAVYCLDLFFFFLFSLYFGYFSVIKFWPQVNPTLDGKIIIKISFWIKEGFNLSFILKCCANLRGQHVHYMRIFFRVCCFFPLYSFYHQLKHRTHIKFTI